MDIVLSKTNFKFTQSILTSLYLTDWATLGYLFTLGENEKIHRKLIMFVFVC